MLTRGLHGLHGLHGLSLKILSIVIIDIALLNEFNALYYRRRDSPGVILRERLKSYNPRNHIFKKKAFQREFQSKQNPHILNYYVEDKARLKRPKEISSAIKEQLI
jgi:hypothetical protein